MISELSKGHNLLKYIIEHSNGGVAVHDKDLNYIYVSRHYLEQYKVQDKNVIGKHHYDVFPDLPQKWRDVHKRALKGEILSNDCDPYQRADGSIEWTRWECRPWYETDGTIGGIVVYTEIITKQKNEKDELEKRLKELSAIYALSQNIQRSITLDILSNELARSLESILNYDYFAFLLIDENTGKMYPFTLSDQGKGHEFLKKDMDYVASCQPAVGKGITGWVAINGKSLKIDDVTKDERYFGLRNGIKSELCVPLKIDDKVIGVINVETTKPAAYNEYDINLLETLSASIAISIRNTELFESNQKEITLRKKTEEELRLKIKELEDFFKLTVGRELKMIELKTEINELLKQLGKKEKYEV
ncbi:TPA: hypothetical protein DCR49_10405 [Candidatus Delongbacteria bacterium]|nr:hypothetical protein [Candidatus Delongbacteria bacterium]